MQSAQSVNEKNIAANVVHGYYCTAVLSPIVWVCSLAVWLLNKYVHTAAAVMHFFSLA